MNKFLFIELTGKAQRWILQNNLIRMRIHGIRDKTFPSSRWRTRIRSDNFISAPKVSAPFFTFSTAAPQSPVWSYPLFRESCIRLEILLWFRAAVTKISSTNNNQRMCREGGRNPDRREALPACLYHICRIRARQGCAAPKGQGLDAPWSLQIIINQARQSLILTVTGCNRT